MTPREIRDRLQARLDRAGAHVTSASLDSFVAYYSLLTRWNPKINLTSLRLEPPADETFDRLFVEPIVADTAIADAVSALPSAPTWIDLGSGGGSPAIPLHAPPAVQSASPLHCVSGGSHAR